MNIRKVWVAILIALSLGLLMSAASAQTVTIADGSADAGATTTVTITADDVTDLANFDITVTYDPAVVIVTDAANDAAFGIAVNNLENVASGSVRLASLNIGAGQTGVGILLSTLTLVAVGTAGQTSPLTLTINELKDSAEGDITATTDDGVFTVSAAAPTLTWQTEPPTPVTQGDEVTFDVSFSECVDYYFRIEDGTGGVVWRYPETGTGSAMNPSARTWTTTTDTPTGDYTIIININGEDNSDTRTVTVIAAPTPTVTIATDAITYSPGDTMIVTLDIANPTSDPVAFEWYIGVPHQSIWVTYARASIPSGFDNSYTIPIPVGNWGPTPFDFVHYVRMLDPVSGEVLVWDYAQCTYSPDRGEAMPVDIAEEIIKTAERAEFSI